MYHVTVSDQMTVTDQLTVTDQMTVSDEMTVTDQMAVSDQMTVSDQNTVTAKQYRTGHLYLPHKKRVIVQEKPRLDVLLRKIRNSGGGMVIYTEACVQQ